MNGLIFDIRHYSIHDGPGIRTTVFLKGCPMRCWWCHNPESQEKGIGRMNRERVMEGRTFTFQAEVGRRQSPEEVMKEITKDEVFYLESGGGVTFSGGEPMMQPNFLSEMLARCKQHGYHTALDTCGSAEPAALKKVIGNTDLFLYDLKIMDDALHVEYTGVSNELSLTNLETIAREGKEVIIRFPVIPGFTDIPQNLEAIAARMTGLGLDRIDLLPYHGIAKHKYRKMEREYFLPEIKEPSKEKMEVISRFFWDHEIEASIGG